jgi:nitrite reductase/ring-hydroxylating ferredoxin subunit
VHYALFDIRTGTADGGVTTTPVQTYPTRVEDGCVYVDMGEASVQTNA